MKRVYRKIKYSAHDLGKQFYDARSSWTHTSLPLVLFSLFLFFTPLYSLPLPRFSFAHIYNRTRSAPAVSVSIPIIVDRLLQFRYFCVPP